MWKKISYQSVGGLRELGFIENSDALMVLGGGGRTIFNALTGEKIARDRRDYYAESWDSKTGIVEGFDLYKGQNIICGGFEYPDRVLKKTFDDWMIAIKSETRPDYKNDLKEAEVMYLVNSGIESVIEVDVYHYSITRAYGFSNTGRSFLTAHSHGINFWIRED